MPFRLLEEGRFALTEAKATTHAASMTDITKAMKTPWYRLRPPLGLDQVGEMRIPINQSGVDEAIEVVYGLATDL